jgi:dienelactone hydrolase
MKFRFYLFSLIIEFASSCNNYRDESNPTLSDATHTGCDINPEAVYETFEDPIKDHQLYGVVVKPKNCPENKMKIVIILGGSEGGIPSFVAKKLATHGFAAIAVGYFGVTDSTLPRSLDLVPLDVLDLAFNFGERQFPYGECCSIFAGSKGAEAAFAYLSVTQRDVKSYVAYAGSGIVFEGLSPNNLPSGHSAWTYQGQPLSYLPYAPPTQEVLQEMFPEGMTKPAVLLPLYRETLKNIEEVSKATSTVEQIAGPILMVSGDEDQLWPSNQFAEAIVARLESANFPYYYRHLSFKNAGHALLFPKYMEIDPYNLRQFGGTIEGNRFAAEMAWPEILKFLDNPPTN